MIKRKLLSALLVCGLTLTTFSTGEIKAADAGNAVNATTLATSSDASYASAFSSLSLATGYKSLTQANPCMTQRYTADPGVMEYNGRVYVYTTNDSYMYDSSGAVTTNTYANIKTINCMSSSDMVNWTDHGTINVAGSSGAAKWAGCSWAPCAAHKTINGKEKFFLYFANNAGGIGVLTSDSPTGPWTDPIGKALISRSTANCSDVTWLFDPAVLVDDDGSAYLYFGGGVPTGQSAHPKTARVVKLGADMTSLSGTPVTIDAPYLFEDSGINKIGNTYYYTYCTNWASRSSSSDPGTAMIAYMTSSSPTGPFTYQGTFLKNPGSYFGYWGNNHHSIINFNNKWYVFYHSQWLENKKLGASKGYRCTHVDELNISNGKIATATGTLTGVTQTSNLNPYTSNQMSTMAWEGGISVSGTGNTTVEMNKGDWLGLSNVAFGNTGAASITMTAASKYGAVIKVCTDSQSGNAIGYISIPATGSTSTFTSVTANITKTTGTKKLFFVASGDCVVGSWKFSTGTTSSETTTENKIGSTVTLTDGWYYIKNTLSQKYLQVADNTGAAGKNVVIGTGSGLAGQKWYLTNVGNGYVTLKSALGNYMLDVNNASNTDGANIQIYNAYSNNAQKFSIKSTSTNGVYTIATMVSDQTKMLDVYNFGTSDGTNVCQWTYGGYNNQQWVFESTSYSESTSSSGDTGSTGTTTGTSGALWTGSSTASSYGIAVTLNTTNTDGTFDAGSIIKANGYFYVEYTGAKDSIELIMQSWLGGANWAVVNPTETGTAADGNYYAKFSYSACQTAYGSEFAKLNKLMVSSKSDAITVKSISYVN